MSRRTYNTGLPPLPDDDAFVAAVAAVADADRYGRGATAQRVAWQLGVGGARRLGRGAQGPRSWTGTMAPALRVAPRLRALAAQGRIVRVYDRDGRRDVYYPADAPVNI